MLTKSSFVFVLTVLFFRPFVHLLSLTESPYNTLWHLRSVPFTFWVHQTILWGFFDLQSFGDLSFGCIMVKWSCHVHAELYSSSIVYDVAMLYQHRLRIVALVLLQVFISSGVGVVRRLSFVQIFLVALFCTRDHVGNVFLAAVPFSTCSTNKAVFVSTVLFLEWISSVQQVLQFRSTLLVSVVECNSFVSLSFQKPYTAFQNTACRI